MAANGRRDGANGGWRAGWRAWALLALLFASAPAASAAATATATALVAALHVQRDGVDVALPTDRRYLRLRGGDRDLRVRLHPQPGAGVRWRLRIEGVDRGWIERRWPAEQAWPQLPPGPHRLLVAVDRGAGWETAEERLLMVDSPWWQTRDVPLLVGALLLALLATAALIDHGRRRREAAWQRAQARREEAERHSEAKTRFLATLGHELRTPMTGVLGMAELLQGGDLSAHQRGQVEAIDHAGRHLLRLVNDALDLARIEAGRLGLERRPFELWPLLQEVLALLQPMAEAKGLEFALACHPRTPEALAGDPTRVRQILFNLGHNAIKFCPRGQVTIQVEPLAPFGLRLVVQDSGPGLDAAQQSRLFRRFEPGADGGWRRRQRPGPGDLRELAVGDGRPHHRAQRAGSGRALRGRTAAAGGHRAAAGAGGNAVRTANAGAAATAGRGRPAGRRRRCRPAAANRPPCCMRRMGWPPCRNWTAAGSTSRSLDLDLPGMDGLQLARIVRGRGRVPLLALTARADAEAEPRRARPA